MITWVYLNRDTLEPSVDIKIHKLTDSDFNILEVFRYSEMGTPTQVSMSDLSNDEIRQLTEKTTGSGQTAQI